MSDFTIYLDEMEERDRKQRRRAKLLGAAAIIATLMAMRRPEPPPPPKPIVILKTEREAVPVLVTRMQVVPKPVIVEVREPRRHKLLRAEWPTGDGLPLSGLPERHLCVTPKRLTVAGASSDRIVVSNVGDKPIRITAIGIVPERSGFVITDLDCANQQLEAGGRCTIIVTALEARNQTIRLVVDDDTGDYDSVRITASPSLPTSASPASRASGS
jgi:hypothetical protein